MVVTKIASVPSENRQKEADLCPAALRRYPSWTRQYAIADPSVIESNQDTAVP